MTRTTYLNVEPETRKIQNLTVDERVDVDKLIRPTMYDNIEFQAKFPKQIQLWRGEDVSVPRSQRIQFRLLNPTADFTADIRLIFYQQLR